MYRVSVLADNGTMAPSELRLNSETFSWLSRIPPILDEHKQLITQSRREAEEGLKVRTWLRSQHIQIIRTVVSFQLRRERFLLELEGYDKQLQEFETYGDLQEIKRYLKKAEALHGRLEEAAERIEGFNAEEEAFDWDRSQYPLRNKLVKILDPYRNLYKTVVEFQSKHE